MATIIQAKYDTLEKIAGRFDQEAVHIEQMQRQTYRALENLQNGGWEGEGAKAFFAEMHNVIFPTLNRFYQALRMGNQVTKQIVDVVQVAEEEAAKPFDSSDYNAIPLTQPAVPFPVGTPTLPGTTPSPSTTPSPEPVPTPPSPQGTPTPGANGDEFSTLPNRDELREDRTDRRVDRQIRSDERWRRDPGGEGSGHLSNDWAGRSILERYLTGEGDWQIQNDPRWTGYMQDNPALTGDLRGRAIETAQALYHSGQTHMNIDETFSMAIENGEGIVGYQYLHGTNANVGGFERDGAATIMPNESGGYLVQMEMTYTWNDVIDPNPIYSTDRWKSTIAEIVTLGQADAYEIHITWSETTFVELDADGNPVSIYNG